MRLMPPRLEAQETAHGYGEGAEAGAVERRSLAGLVARGRALSDANVRVSLILNVRAFAC